MAPRDPNEWLNQAQLDYILNQPQVAPAMPGSDIIGDQGKYLTNLSKFSNATTDLDTLIAMNALNLGAYDPVSVAEPVEAPGYRQMQAWRNGSPFERFVADQMEMGRSPSAIISDVQKFASGEVPGNMDPAEVEAIASSIPRRIDYNTGETQDIADLQYVQDQVLNLDKLRTQDPDYTLDEQGNPMFTTTEESPAGEALMEAGFTTTPGQTYDPYSFAPEGTYERDLGIAENEAATAQRMQALSPDYEKAMQDYLGARREQKRFAPGGPVDQQDAWDESRRKADAATAQLREPDSPGFWDQVTDPSAIPNLIGSGINFMTEYGSAPAPSDDDSPRAREMQAARRNPEYRERYQQAGIDRTRSSKRAASQSKDYKRAERDNMMAGWAGAFARNDDAMRQAMVQELLASGRSPFNDERNYRNAIASGGLY